MNYANFIVKIIEKPEQVFFEDKIVVTEILVKSSQLRSSNSEAIFQVSIWGNLAYDISQYYQVNDYIVIEGYISFRDSTSNQSNYSIDKQIEISALKVYPFLLKNIRIEN